MAQTLFILVAVATLAFATVDAQATRSWVDVGLNSSVAIRDVNKDIFLAPYLNYNFGPTPFNNFPEERSHFFFGNFPVLGVDQNSDNQYDGLTGLPEDGVGDVNIPLIGDTTVNGAGWREQKPLFATEDLIPGYPDDVWVSNPTGGPPTGLTGGLQNYNLHINRTVVQHNDTGFQIPGDVPGSVWDVPPGSILTYIHVNMSELATNSPMPGPNDRAFIIWQLNAVARSALWSVSGLKAFHEFAWRNTSYCTSDFYQDHSMRWLEISTTDRIQFDGGAQPPQTEFVIKWPHWAELVDNISDANGEKVPMNNSLVRPYDDFSGWPYTTAFRGQYAVPFPITAFPYRNKTARLMFLITPAANVDINATRASEERMCSTASPQNTTVGTPLVTPTPTSSGSPTPAPGSGSSSSNTNIIIIFSVLGGTAVLFGIFAIWTSSTVRSNQYVVVDNA